MSRRTAVAAIALTGAVAACQRSATVGSPAPCQPSITPNSLSPCEQAQGWRLLFDGTSLKNFRDYKADTLSSAWHVVNGVITKNVGAEEMVTRDKFGDFEFAWDWRLSPRGNSGVFFRATEEYDKIYWSAIEFQLLDDSLASDNKDSTHLAGAAYGFYMPPRHIAKIGGNWNSSKIVARGGHIEHWMNGVRTLSYDIWTPQWDAMVAKTKFKPYPNFAKAKEGIIGFQGDHPGTLELRNLKIRPLK
ncbi:MAG TPA: family 16 glycoside hydrolase [Gemmatimonadaceae bacterium]